MHKLVTIVMQMIRIDPVYQAWLFNTFGNYRNLHTL